MVYGNIKDPNEVTISGLEFISLRELNMIKLKKILKESKYAWDRKFGDPLPTFKDIAETHQ